MYSRKDSQNKIQCRLSQETEEDKREEEIISRQVEEQSELEEDEFAQELEKEANEHKNKEHTVQCCATCGRYEACSRASHTKPNEIVCVNYIPEKTVELTERQYKEILDRIERLEKQYIKR